MHLDIANFKDAKFAEYKIFESKTLWGVAVNCTAFDIAEKATKLWKKAYSNLNFNPSETNYGLVFYKKSNTASPQNFEYFAAKTNLNFNYTNRMAKQNLANQQNLKSGQNLTDLKPQKLNCGTIFKEINLRQTKCFSIKLNSSDAKKISEAAKEFAKNTSIKSVRNPDFPDIEIYSENFVELLFPIQ